MKNWKTTLGGISAGLSSVAAGAKLIAAGDTINGVLAVSAGLGIIFALFNAADK